MGPARHARTLRAAPQCALCGSIAIHKGAAGLRQDDDGVSRFVIDRSLTVNRVAIGELLAADTEWFLVRNFSRRLGLLLKLGAIAFVDPHTPVAAGDIGFFVRHDDTAEAAAVVGDGLGPLSLKMYNPEEVIPMDNQQIAAVLRIRAVILP